MQPEADPAGPQRQLLHAALLDYASAPGKYQLALRQPPLLFAMLREVLQIASGRELEGAAGGGAPPSELQDAACFFTRTALLYPGADHYALLGLDRTVETADIKDRYRLLMRLLHPDFAPAGSSAWPPDAATRVNRAYEVLSSPTQRREYDEIFPLPAGSQKLGQSEGRRAERPPRQKTSGMAVSNLKKVVAACAVIGIGAVVISFFNGSAEPPQLVQRAGPTADQPVRVALQETHIDLPVPLAPAAGGPSYPRTQEPLQTQSLHTAPLPLAMTAELSASPQEPRRAPPQQLSQQPSRRPSFTPSPVSSPSPPKEIQAAALQEQRNNLVAPAPAEEKIEAPLTATLAVTPAANPPRPAPRPGLTLTEAQPLLSQLLQQMQSGRGERLLGLMEPEARNNPGAQAFSRSFDSLVDGARFVRLSHVEFKAEPGEGRLYVVGHVRLQAGDQTIGSVGKKMNLRAEFASRQGTVVMTGLSGGPSN